ncbi:MAG: class I SAM-dependent methyltransferase [Pseudomonadota bacterium]
MPFVDKVTKTVKAFYQAYPYPSGIPRSGPASEPRVLLERLRGPRASAGPLKILEAGCGCGLGLIAAAKRDQESHFTGVDINPVAIAQAQERAAGEGLGNLRVYPADLLSPEAIESPAGGFDLIYSFGVVHHLSSPVTGLLNLKRLLAPQGVLACMVYGRYAREPLRRLVEAIDLAVDPSLSVAERMEPARLLAEVAEQTLFKGTAWEGTSRVDDIEFADRCLHVHEQSYDIDSLWALLAQSGLSFAAWLEPDDWSIGLFEQAPIRSLVKTLGARDRYKLVEMLFSRPRLELLITRLDG